MLVLILRTTRCPDGVDLHDYGPSETVKGPVSHNLFFRYRTNRREPLRLELQHLQNPVVVDFVNARDDAGLVKFFSTFGLLDNVRSVSEHSVVPVAHFHRSCGDWLAAAGGGDKTAALEALNAAVAETALDLRPEFDLGGENGSPRMLLSALHLRGFMIMEIAMVAMNGARLFRCEHCGSAFLTGPLTGRRSHARFCSDRCRVAAMRERNAQRAKS